MKSLVPFLLLGGVLYANSATNVTATQESVQCNLRMKRAQMRRHAI